MITNTHFCCIVTKGHSDKANALNMCTVYAHFFAIFYFFYLRLLYYGIPFFAVLRKTIKFNPYSIYILQPDHQIWSMDSFCVYHVYSLVLILFRNSVVVHVLPFSNVGQIYFGIVVHIFCCYHFSSIKNHLLCFHHHGHHAIKFYIYRDIYVYVI